MQGVNFRNANLENADLSDIITARPIQVLLQPGEECFYNTQLLDEVFTTLAGNHKCTEIVFQNEAIRTNFNDANLRGVTMNFSEYGFLHYIDFSGADLTGIEISNVGLRDCKFIGTNLNDSRISADIFYYVDFSNAELKNSQFTKTSFFQNVSFHNTKIIDGYFEEPVFVDVNFSNADLKGTVINDAIIIGDTVLNCKNNQICK